MRCFLPKKRTKHRVIFRHVSLCNTVNGVYDEIAHYRKNIFNVPSGRAGKSFIEELTLWIKQFNADSDLNSVALKAFMVLPTLILQKPSATSKSKEHSAAIERRLALWKQRDIDFLLKLSEVYIREICEL